MKKIEYKTPEMEVIKLSVQKAVLQALSGGGGSTPVSGRSTDPNDPDDLP